MLKELYTAALGMVPQQTRLEVLSNNIANANTDAGQFDRAIPILIETLEKRKAKLGPDHPDTLTSMNNLAMAYKATGKLDKALPLLAAPFL